MLYKDLIKSADKYYDIVFIDLPKTLDDEITKVLLETSHIIVYTFTKNLKQADVIKKINLLKMMSQNYYLEMMIQ